MLLRFLYNRADERPTTDRTLESVCKNEQCPTSNFKILPCVSFTILLYLTLIVIECLLRNLSRTSAGLLMGHFDGARPVQRNVLPLNVIVLNVFLILVERGRCRMVPSTIGVTMDGASVISQRTSHDQ